MAHDQSPDTPPRPQGAGSDDDDDWVRRDHGPRPHVPDHGRRPLLMALPVFLIALAAVAAILIAGCGDDDAGDTPPATGGGAPAPTSEVSSADAVAVKVAEGSALLSGRADPDTFADTTCEAAKLAGEYRCAYGGEGDPNSGSLTVRLQPTGAVSKVLGDTPPQAGLPAPTRVAELLAADDAASGSPGTAYRCATATAINPDGSSAGTSETGYRCVLIEGGKPFQRYVQFAADGTVVRDFEVTAP